MAHSVQDRTPEFRSILAEAQRQIARQRKQPAPAPQTRKQRSEFARNAAAIGRGISSTVSKLERLGELARRKTLFDDRPVEINELTYVIKQDLAGLNEKIGQLRSGQREKGEEAEHKQNVVVLLQKNLADVSVNFKEVLEVRTRNIQATRSRQDNFVSAVSSQTPLGTPRTDSPLYQMPPRKPEQDTLSLEPSSGGGALYQHGGGMTQNEQLSLMEEGSSSYVQQRGEAIEAIERTINELGGIFGQLAQMVSEQAEQIQRIDANTDSVVDNIDGAQRELIKYWHRVQGNRWLVAKMFGILMIFFLLWVMVTG
ncbi:putative ER-golgi SNARE complex subunit [Piedraia hortae CBS 480.64]|uniref:Putative ER-golgi SNARE complex subunit n=1 Tax=Piedraia hortae CBS 480.64 TaxID=1314780 RepID=A0A6A7C9I0_9PEZI|nr:putative ER-golgi SNARE complex subunit [Piedraia hortae CBS 480.64]